MLALGGVNSEVGHRSRVADCRLKSPSIGARIVIIKDNDLIRSDHDVKALCPNRG